MCVNALFSKHDPEKWELVFSDKQFPFVQRSCSIKNGRPLAG
ncbi:hypothetical protein X743_31580 [Mesorhizobium sp. LNHC252B00]|nr:hypothetical protein X743_31580 [Mesorhizobium sp. LNHC252B00]